jgi:hypothetical protein
MNICIFTSTEEFDPISVLIRAKCDSIDNGQTFSAMADGKGVTWRPVSQHQTINLLLDHQDPTVMQAAFQKALTQLGRPYDELDILGIALGRDWCTANHFICSVLVFWAFDQVGSPLLAMWGQPLEHFWPCHARLSPCLKQRITAADAK